MVFMQLCLVMRFFHFTFLEMLHDLMGSAKFTDVNNLCINPSLAD